MYSILMFVYSGRMRVGRSASGGLAEGGTGGSSSPTAARRKAAHARHQPVLDLTVFRVPGLDLKVRRPYVRLSVQT